MKSKYVVISTLMIAGLFACDREGARRIGMQHSLMISLDTSRGARNATVAVTGWSSRELDELGQVTANERWQRLLRVTVAGHEDVAIAGRYAVRDSALEFRPQFPLDAGRSYAVHLDPRQLSRPRNDTATVAVVALPARSRTPATYVVRILPSGDRLPENLLRLYIEFSAPMSRVGGLPFMKLLDANGNEVRDAFLPLDADYWNDDRTRYTVFLDPGRVKRGILPNEQMGRALISGRRYSLVIDARWPDGAGVPLVAPFARSFVAGAADEAVIALKAWRVSAPRDGSRDTLVVTFPKSLDHGLLKRAIGVETADGKAVEGTVEIRRAETEWRFAPSDTWRGGSYRLLVLNILEDAAGNRVDRPFEVDAFDRVDKNAAPERFYVPFTIR